MGRDYLGQFAWQHDNLVGIVESGNDTIIKRWSVPSGRPLPGSVLLSSDGAAMCAVLSSDGRLAAIWNIQESKSKVRVIDVASKRVLLTLPATQVDGVVFSRDGRLLVVNDGHGGLHTMTLSDDRTTVSHGWPTRCGSIQGEFALSAVAISDDDRDWLTQYREQLLAAYATLTFPLPPGPIHADALRGNLLRGNGRVVLADWDTVSTGPREIDLVHADG